LWRGLLAVWNHQPRGGYGYLFRIPAEVVSVDGDRVTILVEKADGTKAERTVARSSVWVPCTSCRHAVHRGICQARSDTMGYACGCSRDTTPIPPNMRPPAREKGGAEG